MKDNNYNNNNNNNNNDNNNCSSRRSSKTRLQVIIFVTKKTCLTNTLLWLDNDKTDIGQRTHVKFHF